MNLLDLSSGVEVISYEECRELLGSERVGRLGVVVDGRPEIFPVNYGLDGDGVLLRSNRGLKVTAALVGEVAFEVDRIDLDTHSGWSVVVHGRAEDISHFDGPVLRARAEDPWTGPKDALLRIDMTSVTGRRVTPASR
ncbi:MAG: pyridoxamine 5'-phosphate oxidase family protein [Acidimicrobiales bacterium]|jgi:nitroimidazol reductase NimA-like FMN-containing flavoprotein (pyridoxamine 5'-phosphate oxidase superfamily)